MDFLFVHRQLRLDLVQGSPQFADLSQHNTGVALGDCQETSLHVLGGVRGDTRQLRQGGNVFLGTVLEYRDPLYNVLLGIGQHADLGVHCLELFFGWECGLRSPFGLCAFDSIHGHLDYHSGCRIVNGRSYGTGGLFDHNRGRVYSRDNRGQGMDYPLRSHMKYLRMTARAFFLQTSGAGPGASLRPAPTLPWALTQATTTRRIIAMTDETTKTTELSTTDQPRGSAGRFVPTSDLLPMPLSKVAKMTDINKSHLSRLLAGKKRMYLDQAVAIADTIGMPLDKFAEYLERQSTAA